MQTMRPKIGGKIMGKAIYIPACATPFLVEIDGYDDESIKISSLFMKPVELITLHAEFSVLIDNDDHSRHLYKENVNVKHLDLKIIDDTGSIGKIFGPVMLIPKRTSEDQLSPDELDLSLLKSIKKKKKRMKRSLGSPYFSVKDLTLDARPSGAGSTMFSSKSPISQ